MLHFGSCKQVAETQCLGSPLPEYTIHTDLLNAALLLYCIMAASEQRPEECRTRDRGSGESKDMMEERSMEGGEK